MSDMKPFDKFLFESKKIRQKYAVWIERKPEDKAKLTAEMNAIIESLLEECEQAERNAINTRINLGSLGIKSKATLRITQKK